LTNKTEAVVTTNGETDVADRMRGWSGSIAGGEDMFRKTLSPCLFKAARAIPIRQDPPTFHSQI
jgi:hypothetical protein